MNRAMRRAMIAEGLMAKPESPAPLPMTEPVKVCIAYPSGDYVHVSFVASLLSLLLHCLHHISPAFRPPAITGHNGSRITVNRNNLVEMARQSGASHILFMDADMVFPANALERLIAHKKDIVGATACKRDGSGKAIGQFMVGDESTPRVEVKGGLVEAAVIGLPFMLIRMSVFDRMRKPYFAEPVSGVYPEGEDLYFCRNARELGFKVWCDVDLSKEMGHIGTKVYYIEEGQVG